MESAVVRAARCASRATSPRPLYLRMAEALAACLEGEGNEVLPPARELARQLAVNRATATAAYRELARRGLVVLRPGRPYRQPRPHEASVPMGGAEVPRGVLDLARYAPDRELLPPGRVFRWLGLGEGEGESVAQYGSTRGYPPLREWLAGSLQRLGIATSADRILLTGGLQHALDLLLRALLRPGDAVLVEDPTYPGLPPLLALHQAVAIGLPVHRDGILPEEAAAALGRTKVRAAILTPTLHNPSGVVLDAARRRKLLALLRRAGALVIEEFFDPALVCDGEAPPAFAALDPGVVAVGSFSKALFPGLRVGWITGPAALVDRAAAVKCTADLSGSTFLEAAAWALCRRGVLEAQFARLRRSALARRRIVLEVLETAPPGVGWSRPRGGFSLLVTLPPGQSSRDVAARAAKHGVWVLPGPAMSVTGRDDVLRVAYAAVGGVTLRRGMKQVVAALAPERGGLPLV
ncbi:MAG: PLP-dependent aminotransferase family protein [Thermoanaerobaculales bacterium]